MVLLGGLLRCAGCGHTLKIAGSRSKSGKYYPTYYCNKRFASGLCSAPATITASHVDPYVEERVLSALKAEDGLLAQAAQASAELERTQRAVDQAEHELDQFITDPQLLTLLGKQKFMQGADARQRALDQARADLSTLRTQSTLAEELTSGDLLAAWPTSPAPEKRQLLHGLLDRVVLQADPNSRTTHSLSVSERTTIMLRGNVLLPAPD